MVQEIVTVLPTADALIALTDQELERVLLRYVIACMNDQLRKHASCEGTIVSLFEPTGPYHAAKRAEVERKVRRAWRALERAELLEEPDPTNGKGGYRIASAEGRRVNTDVDFEAAKHRAWLTPNLIHAAIANGESFRAFQSGDYSTAITEAYVAVEAAVLAKAPIPAPNNFGVGLMQAAFEPNAGPLTDQNAGMPQRNARQRLFMGAIGVYRNPPAHGGRPVIANPVIAIEQMMNASGLLRIVDSI